MLGALDLACPEDRGSSNLFPEQAVVPLL